MRWVEQTVADRDPLLLWSRVTPFWETIRKDPRFDGAVRPLWS
jgi:hypothetical protein